MAAILSAQGIVATGSQLSALLSPLTGETPVSATVVQPGEEIWLIEGRDDDCSSCKVDDGYVSLEAVSEEIADRIRESRNNNRGWGNSEITEEAFDVLIVRKAVRPVLEEKFVVTL